MAVGWRSRAERLQRSAQSDERHSNDQLPVRLSRSNGQVSREGYRLRVMSCREISFLTLWKALLIGAFVFVASGCGSSIAEVASSDAQVEPSTLPQEEADVEESTGSDEVDSMADSESSVDESAGISPEEQEADDLALLMASELTISGEASASAVLGEPFGVDVEVAVASSVGLVSVDFVLPDGVLLVGGDCSEGSGTVRCFVADELSHEDPGELAVELVLDSGAGFVVGDVVVVEAIATNSLSEFELNELTELTPEDNVIAFEIVVA